eukprot:TRINITY_DN3543_c0_g1_i2.p1 TRINITY_DN3543_c0_g1~~TRINITY_DN3543_c0_g1_i2.p1  ORF type:complete len:421 (+),score=131.79 TRINITY_DN3543_c0_g1_i2:181-1443(+)
MSNFFPEEDGIDKFLSVNKSSEDEEGTKDKNKPQSNSKSRDASNSSGRSKLGSPLAESKTSSWEEAELKDEKSKHSGKAKGSDEDEEDKPTGANLDLTNIRKNLIANEEAFESMERETFDVPPAYLRQKEDVKQLDAKQYEVFEITEDLVQVQAKLKSQKDDPLAKKKAKETTLLADLEDYDTGVAEPTNKEDNVEQTKRGEYTSSEDISFEDISPDPADARKEYPKEELKEPPGANREGVHEYQQYMLQFIRPYFSNKSIKNELSKDINAGYVRLNWLLDTSSSREDQLPQCKKCFALLNSLSCVDGKDKGWTCEFCGAANKCSVKAPKSGTTLETLGECPIVEKQTKIILCIDISPSMNATIIEESPDKNKNPIYFKKGTKYVSYWMKLQKSVCNLLNNVAVDFPNTCLLYTSDAADE